MSMTMTMTMAEYAGALAMLPLGFADLPWSEVKIAIIGHDVTSIIVAHPSRLPLIWNKDQGWRELKPYWPSHPPSEPAADCQA